MTIITAVKTISKNAWRIIGFFTRLWALCFLLGSTIYMWYLYLRAVMNGGWICFTTNQVGEQNMELMMAALGFACVLVYLSWLFKKFLMGKGADN